MARDARFWRNLAIIAVAHMAVAILLVGWSSQTRKLDPPGITWIGGGGADVESKLPRAHTDSSVERATPKPVPRDEQPDAPAPSPAKRDIVLPVATPSPTPVKTPTPRVETTPVPKPSPKSKPTPTPKKTPKKTTAAKATPSPTPKTKVKIAEPPAKKEEDTKEKEPAKENEPAKSAAAGVNGADGAGSGNGTRASEFSWYGKMLYNRFYSEWIQPTTSVAAGSKMSAVARVRIEPDGRVSKFTIVQPSGNVVVDESVAAVGKRVTRVDPLPNGLGSGAAYEVNINFALNPTE